MTEQMLFVTFCNRAEIAHGTDFCRPRDFEDICYVACLQIATFAKFICSQWFVKALCNPSHCLHRLFSPPFTILSA